MIRLKKEIRDAIKARKTIDEFDFPHLDIPEKLCIYFTLAHGGQVKVRRRYNAPCICHGFNLNSEEAARLRDWLNEVLE